MGDGWGQADWCSQAPGGTAQRAHRREPPHTRQEARTRLRKGPGTRRATRDHFSCVLTTPSLRCIIHALQTHLSKAHSSAPSADGQLSRATTSQGSPAPEAAPCRPSLPPAPADTRLLPVSVGLPFLDSSQKWNPQSLPHPDSLSA